jgi:hypothetical protein
MTPENLLAPPPSSVPLRRGVPGRAQPPQDPAQRAKLPGAIRFRAFPPLCLALGSQFIAMPARYEFADPLTLHFRSPDTQAPPQWP